MTHEHTHQGKRSERGMALIMVLLLLAVVSSLATGLTMNGQVEVAMASNEATYAGSRAAAEAGMNRVIAAIVDDTTNDLLAGADGLMDPDDPNAAVNADNGDVGFLLTTAPPYTIGTNDEFWYEIQVFDDDDPALYGGVALTADQLTAMGEDGNPNSNLNERMILRVAGFGPNGTVVRVGRILESNVNTETTTTTTTTITNPALLVNGDLDISGSIDVDGDRGNIHANGDIALSGGGYSISGDVTATGTLTGSTSGIDGVAGGNRPSVTVPDIDANNYFDLATHILHDDGTMTAQAGAPACALANCGWSFSGGGWHLTGNGNGAADPGTFFVEGNVTISGNPNAGGTGQNRVALPLSVIATGSIEVTGTPTLRPHNGVALQFVTNGDLRIAGNADFDNTQVEGQSLVREQVLISGNPDLRGQIIAQNVTDCDPCSNVATANAITGNMSILYDGSFGDLVTEETTTVTGPTTYFNNIVGWIEGM